MKKIIKKEVCFCDLCKKESNYPTPCLGCGSEVCYECQKKSGVVYPHAVHLSGSGDGFYCDKCDAKLWRNGTDKLHGAYRAVAALRTEAMAWNKDFTQRRVAAEELLKGLQPAR